MKSQIALFIIVALGLAMPVLQAEGLAERSQRILQGNQLGGTYQIVEHPDVKKNCEDKGYSSKEIQGDSETRKAEREKIKGRYAEFFPLIDKVASDSATDQEKKDLTSNVITKTAIGFAGVIAVLSTLSVIFLFFWSIFECCCEKTICVDKQKHHEGRGGFRVICWILTVIIGVITIVAAIIWSVYLGKVSGRSGEIKCAGSILYSDITRGANITKTSRFIGTDGLDNFIGQMQEVLVNLTTI